MFNEVIKADWETIFELSVKFELTVFELTRTQPIAPMLVMALHGTIPEFTASNTNTPYSCSNSRE